MWDSPNKVHQSVADFTMESILGYESCRKAAGKLGIYRMIVCLPYGVYKVDSNASQTSTIYTILLCFENPNNNNTEFPLAEDAICIFVKNSC